MKAHQLGLQCLCTWLFLVVLPSHTTISLGVNHRLWKLAKCSELHVDLTPHLLPRASGYMGIFIGNNLY